MAHAALEWPKKTAARAYGTLARLRLARCGSGARSILIYQKTHLIVAPIQSRTQGLRRRLCGDNPVRDSVRPVGLHLQFRVVCTRTELSFGVFAFL